MRLIRSVTIIADIEGEKAHVSQSWIVPSTAIFGEAWVECANLVSSGQQTAGVQYLCYCCMRTTKAKRGVWGLVPRLRQTRLGPGGYEARRDSEPISVMFFERKLVATTTASDRMCTAGK